MLKLFYVGIKAIITNDKHEILLLKSQRNNQQPYWDIPGGRIEDNESIFDALTRELREELPFVENIKIHELIHVYQHPKIFETGTGLLLCFYKVTANFKHMSLSDEHCQYLWVNKFNFNDIEREAILNSEYKNMLAGLLFHS